MDLNVILNVLLSGGLLACIVEIAKLRQTVRKAAAEASREEAEAERLRIDNAEAATKVLLDYLMKPLLEKLHETTEELNLTKRELQRNTSEMARFRRAIERATGCDYRDVCPVLDELRKQPKDGLENRGYADKQRQARPRAENAGDDASADVGGHDGTQHERPARPARRRQLSRQERQGQP